MNKQFHPYANCFPFFAENRLQELADDIRENGLALSILVDEDDLILDGRNRYKACLLAGVSPRFEVFKGDDKAKLRIVTSLNERRRHMTDVERAAAAHNLANCIHGTNQHYEKVEGSQDPSTPKEKKPDSVTLDEAAEACGVSRATVVRYRKVAEEGAPELIEAMENEDIGIREASEIAKLPKEEQVVKVQEKTEAKKQKKKKRSKQSNAVTKEGFGYVVAPFGKETRFQKLIAKATAMGRIEEGKFWRALSLSREDGERQWFYDICRELPWIKWVTSAGFVQVEAIADHEELTLMSSIIDRIEKYCLLVKDVVGQHDYNHHDARVFARDMVRLLAPIQKQLKHVATVDSITSVE